MIQVKLSDPDGVEPLTSPVYTFEYDSMSRVTREIDPLGRETSYVYDAMGRLVETIRPDHNGDGNLTISSQTYEALGWLASLTDPLGRVTSLAYHSLHQLQSVTLPSLGDAATPAWSHTYLLDLTHSQPGGAGVLAGYNWTFDVAGRVTQFTSVIDGTATYTYDDTDQLIGADYDYQTDEAYTFDANGNRTNPGYTTGANNRLLSDGTYNYEYDAEGNRTKKIEIATGDETSYSWDHRNRLVMVVEADSLGTILKTVRFGYDAFDQRIWKMVTDAAGTRTESYIHDGLRPERDFAGDHLLLRFDTAGDLTNRYLHGPAVDQILADEQIDPSTGDSQVLWPLTDNLGSVRDIAELDDATGITSIINHIVYDAFGQATSQTDAAVDHIFNYTGREWDPDATLYYYRARWYDPVAGRLLSQDPIGFAARDANLYRYVGNQPTIKTDPSGLKPPLTAGGISPYFGNEMFDQFMADLFAPIVNAAQSVSDAIPPYRNSHFADKPNIGAARGTFHKTYNEITFRVANVKDCAALQSQIFNELKQFEHFNAGVNRVAVVDLNATGDRAYFDALGGMGWGSDLIGNADKSPVALHFDPKMSLVIGSTLEGHMLEGKRFWTVSVKRGPYCDADVTVTTFAYERKVGVVNDWGAWWTGTSNQLQIWDQYLMNIMNAHGGHPLGFSVPGPYHYHQDTRSTTLPELPGIPLNE